MLQTQNNALEKTVPVSEEDSQRPPPGKPFRILYLDHTSKIGGGEIAIFNLASSLDRTKFCPVFLLASPGPLVDRLKAASIETYVVELNPEVTEIRKDSLGLSSLLKFRDVFVMGSYITTLAKWIKRLDIDIVHTNSLKSDVYGAIAARISGKPVVWHVRDAIDEAYLPAVVAFGFRQLARILPQFVVGNSSSTLSKLRLGRHNRTAVVYSGVADTLLKNQQDKPQFVGATPSNPHALDLDLGTQIVTMVGRIAEWKGQHIFIRAASAVLKKKRNVVFQIVGSPLFGEHDYEQSLFRLAKELGIECQVSFLGFKDNVSEIVAGSDLIVHASITGEPFGQVVVEGMAAGKPVIATNGGALPEIVVNGETGILVPMANVEEMAAAMERILSDPTLASAMGKAGRKRVSEMFTLHQSASRIQSVYNQMLARQN